MLTRSKTIALVVFALIVSSSAVAHTEGIFNPTANSVGNFEGIDSNGASNAPAAPPLDGLTTGIKAAYSTRKLLTAYAGNAIQVQETTGNTTSNIGFVANVLDTSTLSTFCSGKICKVITWYDQSGGGFDQTQAAATAPTIYQSGATNAINTKPAPLFVSASSTLLTNAIMNTNPANTQWQNAVVSLPSAGAGIIGPTLSGNFLWRTNGTNLEILSANTASIATSTSGFAASTGAVIENQYNSTTGAWAFWINRAAAGSGTQIQALSGNAGTDIAADRGTSFANGSIGEVIIYDLVGGIPGASQTSIENNQKAYWGTP